MMASPRPDLKIPTFYRVVFLYVDPIFCFLAFTLHILPSNHAHTLLGYSPTAKILLSQHTEAASTITLLLENLAGFFLTLGVLEAVLLRAKGSDVTVWRIVQSAVLLLDVVMLYTHSKALFLERRWDIATWRGDDYRNIVGNAAMGAARMCCALGVGMPQTVRAKTT